MIEYREFDSALIDEVHEIYEANKWESYLGNKEKCDKQKYASEQLLRTGLFYVPKQHIQKVGNNGYIDDIRYLYAHQDPHQVLKHYSPL